ncbi:hypothetical protein ACOMHN_008419 [Nucella lapillus]
MEDLSTQLGRLGLQQKVAVSLEKTEPHYVLGLAAQRLGGKDSLLAASSSNYTVRLFSRCQLAQTNVLTGHEDVITAIQFLHDDPNLLMTASEDKTVRIWDLRTSVSKEVQSFEGENNTLCRILSCDVSKSDKVLCAGTEQGKDDAYLLFWDRRKNKLLGCYQDSHQDDIVQVRFHPTSEQTLLSGSTDGLVNVFDIQQTSEDDALVSTYNTESTVGKCTADYLVDWISSAAPSNEGRLVVGTHSGDLHLLDVTDPEEIKVTMSLVGGHSDTVRCLHWDEQTESLVTGGEDSLLCLWSPESAGPPSSPTKRHIKSHKAGNRSLRGGSQQNFACEFCAQIFMNRYSLKAHIRRKHSGEQPIECDICGKVQPGTFALSAHKKACHDFNSLCHICGAEFSARTSFDKHMASHEGIKRYFCDICGAGFVHNSSLNNHSSIHLTTKSYQCHVCSQMFKAQSLLNEHLLKVHQCGPSLEHRIRGLKKMGVDVDKAVISRHANHQCVICSEPLVDSVCVAHRDSSQEVFHCPTCGDRTSNIVLFYQHIKWHRGTIVSHSRRTCVSTEAPVSRHLASSESGRSDSVIKCEVCSKTFKNFEYLSAHMHQHREARFVCDICNRRFTYKCNLKSHMSTHLDMWQFECEACQKKFRDKYAFKKHQLKHTEPQFKCQVCGKALTRRPYLLKHYQKMHPEYQGAKLS